MTEQRIVPVELLEDCIREAGYVENYGLIRRLSAIIDGPGVEPAGEVKDELDLLEVLFKGYGPSMAASEGFRAIRNLRKLYLASPSAPVARCHECGKLASDGWALYCVECAEKVAPVASWIDGAPPFPQNQEWFIATTIYDEKVVLRALPEEYAYDYTTADYTYIKASNIRCWMQFPDCEYRPPKAAPPSAPVPEGCTPEDARVLREANHALAGESSELQVVLASLLRQIEDHCVKYGEADFYTGDAQNLMNRLNGLPPAVRHLEAPAQAVPDGWSIEPYGDNGIALRNGEEWDEFYPKDTVRMDFVFRLLSAMLASTLQPDTAQPSAVACPPQEEPKREYTMGDWWSDLDNPHRNR